MYGQYILLVCILVCIFILSSQSAQESKALSNHFISIYQRGVEINPFFSHRTKEVLLSRPSHYVRKLAHIFIYFILGIVTLLTLWRTQIRRSICPLLALMICIIYAITDEWHQYYVAGRGAQLSDVRIDSCGALIGIMLSVVIIKIIGSLSNKLKGK
nr:VanZ family protein [uncultured Cellulosilyticum sp.]